MQAGDDVTTTFERDGFVLLPSAVGAKDVSTLHDWVMTQYDQKRAIAERDRYKHRHFRGLPNTNNSRCSAVASLLFDGSESLAGFNVRQGGRVDFVLDASDFTAIVARQQPPFDCWMPFVRSFFRGRKHKLESVGCVVSHPGDLDQVRVHKVTRRAKL
jgi:hypothetical protein